MSLFLVLLFVLVHFGQSFDWATPTNLLFGAQKQMALANHLKFSSKSMAEGLLYTPPPIRLPTLLMTTSDTSNMEIHSIPLQSSQPIPLIPQTNPHFLATHTQKLPQFIRLIDNSVKGQAIHSDKTYLIPYLEQKLTKYKMLTLHRPPHMGKSTFLSMLECYYSDLHKDKHNQTFDKLQVKQLPITTTNFQFEANSFKIIRLNFGLDLAYNNNNEYCKLICQQLIEHIQLHNLPIDIQPPQPPQQEEEGTTKPSNHHHPRHHQQQRHHDSPATLLSSILQYYQQNNHPIMILIDDIDYAFNSYINNKKDYKPPVVPHYKRRSSGPMRVTNPSQYLKPLINTRGSSTPLSLKRLF